uniref:Insertion sequence element putative transposase orfA n=1 Tax=uncultured bacterium UPO76 TaxID=1776993 RepID=A0A140DZZ3_9BACT|nr:insertion sequence element putative transposase orfA [uncultured bacterium UPO76]
MSNVLSEQKRQQVLVLGRLGWSLRRIEEATGVRRETASAYLRAADVRVRRPGWRHRDPPGGKPAIETSTDPGEAAGAKPAMQVSTDSSASAWPPAPRRSPQASACEPHREWIAEAVARGRNAVAIYQELVERHGFASSYASVRRFVKVLRAESAKVRGGEPHPVIVTAAGEEAQVDYGGDGPMVRDPESGKYRRTRLFVLTLGYSRKCVRLLTWRSSAEIWARLHEDAFRRLGGVPHTVVLDNLKEGVAKADLFDPALNPLYRDLLAHYGATALPCRVRHPDRKGKVERAVGHAQATALRGLRFESLEEAQAHLDHWEERWADTRIHGTTKRQVAAMFAEERPHLLPLPVEPFRFYRFGTRTVHLDGAVEVEGAYYHLPPGWLGRRVAVQWDGLHVRVLDPSTGTLVREHIRQKRGQRRMREEDRPARTPPTTVALLARALSAGPHIGALCEAIHRQDGEAGVRRILGVLALVRRHGPRRAEEACEAALELAVPTYRFVQRFLVRRARETPLPLKQVDPLIRQLTLYRDAVERLGETNPEEGGPNPS